MKRLGVRVFLSMAGAGAIGVILWFVVMQLAFGAAQGPPAALVFEIVGFVAFLLWLACAVVTVVGLVGALWRRCHKAPIRIDPPTAFGALAGRLQRTQWPAGPCTAHLRETSRC